MIPPLKKFISSAEIKRAPFLFIAYIISRLELCFGINAGPKVGIVFTGRSCFTVSGSGKYDDDADSLPLGLLLGLGRSAVGGTFSLCRDTALGIIGDKYGLESREGMGNTWNLY